MYSEMARVDEQLEMVSRYLKQKIYPEKKANTKKGEKNHGCSTVVLEVGG